MPLLQSFNYNRQHYTTLSASLLSTSPFLLLFILLLMNYTCRGQVFSFTEEAVHEEKSTKIDSESNEKANLNIVTDEKVETSTIDSVKVEQKDPNIDQSPPTTQQQENEAAESTSPSPIKQSIIETSTVHPEPSAPTTTTTIMPQEGNHPHTKRNYASKECGAKVLYSNEEAENKGAILNDPERDDYMRNPCERAQNKFLIIELCETIQLNSFEIANFELFSSNPKDFRLWSSERYPTQEWVLIGDFEAQNIRQVQSFDVKQATLYAKFVKLELLTHYGNEHFCTLSTFVVYGTSIVDEYEAEAASTTLQQQFNKIEDNLSKEEINREHKNNITSNETIEECSKVLGDNQQKEETTKNDQEENLLIKNDQKNNTNSTINEENLNNNKQLIDTGNMLKTIVEQLGSNIKNVIGQAFSKTSEKEENNKNIVNSTKKNVSRYTYSSCQQSSLKPSPSTSNYLNIFCWTFFPNINRLIKHKQQQQQYLYNNFTIKKFNKANKYQNYFLDKVLLRQTSSFCPLPSLPLTCNRKSETTNNEELKHLNNNTNNKNNNNSSEQVLNVKQVGNKVVETIVGESGGENVVKTQTQKPVTPTYVLDEKVSRPLPGTSTNSKESIFMKLNKRLVLLEQNMSTCNEHLNELTKRVGTFQQNNEFTESFEKIVKTTAENVAKHETKKVKEEMQLKVNDLQLEVRRLSQLLNTVLTSIQPIKPDGTYSHNNEKTCTMNGIGSYTSPSYYSQMISNWRSEEDYARQEGLWTTNEVIVLVIIVQIGTLIALKLIRSFMIYVKNIGFFNSTKTQVILIKSSSPN